MKLRIAPILLSLLISNVALAEYQPDPLEPAPITKVECSWSKLSSEEYKVCLEKKKFFDKMNSEEKTKYNVEVEKRITDARMKRLERVIPGIPVGQ